jgi:hypothetical protein
MRFHQVVPNVLISVIIYHNWMVRISTILIAADISTRGGVVAKVIMFIVAVEVGVGVRVEVEVRVGVVVFNGAFAAVGVVTLIVVVTVAVSAVIGVAIIAVSAAVFVLVFVRGFFPTFLSIPALAPHPTGHRISFSLVLS